ncbi:MAG: tetratricopeptide repeat protein [Firmicutes bacterium]|nr:tetratricopeptide repeat protein [Bacillota bacterium]
MYSRSLFFALLTPALVANAYEPRTDLEAGRYLKALGEAEARLKANSNNALAWAAKSQALSAMQRFGEALASAEQALRIQPNLADAYLARGLARAGTAVQQRNFSSLRNASGALDDLEQATRLDGRLTTAWMSLGLAYEQLPGLLGGSTRKALACAAQLRAVNGPKGDLLQGMVLAMASRWSEAEPFFQRALSQAPGDPEIVYGYLDSLGSREARKRLGDAEQKRRQAQEARRLYPSVCRSAKALEAITDALLDAGQGEEAWSVAKGALAQVDAPSLLRLQLGKLAARSGLHLDEGLAYLDQAVREPLEGGSGGLPSAHWRRGQILKALGRAAEARAAAQTALRFDPRHPGAKKLLEELG